MLFPTVYTPLQCDVQPRQDKPAGNWATCRRNTLESFQAKNFYPSIPLPAYQRFGKTMVHRLPQLLTVFTLVLSATPGFCLGDDSAVWAQFRGPTGNGVSTEKHPTQWSDAENLAWSVEIPGGGWSSPIVSGGNVFVTTAVSEDKSRPKGWGEGVQSMGSFYRSQPPAKPLKFELHCISLSDGKRQWATEIVSRKPKHKIHPSNSYATESPVTDGNAVYAYFASIGVVACVDFDGTLKWQRDLGEFKTSNDFGTGSSLAIHAGRLFVQCDNEEASFVCALDTKTGQDVWRVDRSTRTSWSSPIVWENQLRVELIVCGSGNVTAYQPETGKVLWSLTGTGGAYSASPTSDSKRIYFGNSGRTSRGPLVAVNAGASGELTLDSIGDDAVAWVQESAGPGMCSPVVVDGRLYVLSRGILTCHDAKTGKKVYRERLQNASSVTSSLWSADGKVFALNESGETMVISVGDKFELLSSNTTEGLFWSTPSIAAGSLLLRDAATVRCIRQ